jgi:hypothetical protein
VEGLVPTIETRDLGPINTLVMFDQFWDFDRLIEDGAPGEAEIAGSCPPFADFFGFGFM